MDKENFVQKVKLLCLRRNVRPTNACRDSGAGISLISDINRGKIPSVERVQLLAAYLGVTTSELLGEAVSDSDTLAWDERNLVEQYRQLNREGREKLTEYAQDLLCSGRYIKTGAADLPQDA